MGASRVRLLALALLAAAAIAVLIVFGLAPGHTPAIGRAAPALPRERLAGPPVTLSSLRAGAGGRPTLVLFWASWCHPCQQEAGAIERFANSARGRGRIVGVDWGDALSEARSFVARHGWSFPNVRDGDGTTGNAYQLPGLPTTYVLDGGGRIRSALRGPQDGASLSRALTAVERA